MGRKLYIDDTVMYSMGRHPDFDKMWEENRGIVFWWSRRLARIFNSATHSRFKYHYGDFLGYLTIRFNYCLYNHDPIKSRFVTYFSSRMIVDIKAKVLRYESESEAVRVGRREARPGDIKISQMNREFHESDYHLYRVPQNDTWSEEMLDLLASMAPTKNLPVQQAAWEFLMLGVKERNRHLLEMRWIHGRTLADCAAQFNITKQRAEQIESTTKRKIKERLEKLEPVRKLFFG